MTAPVINTLHLTKFYGKFEAVHDLTLQVGPGIVFGFIGHNGAGKTTTIRMLCGLLRPTSGQACVAGVDVGRHPRQVKALVGYLAEFFGTYDQMRVWEYLDFYGAAYRIPRTRRRDRVDSVLHLTGTEYMRDYFMGTLSRGMRQRVGIAKTLVHDPAVLFLDEPTSGLDPVARIEVRELLYKLKSLGKTICISSHILPELASVCDEVAIIEKSRLLAAGSIKKILEETRQTRRIQVEFLSRADEAAALLQCIKGVSQIKVQHNVVQFECEGDDAWAARLLRWFVEKDLPICWMREVEADLEEAFIHVTRRGEASEPEAPRT